MVTAAASSPGFGAPGLTISYHGEPSDRRIDRFPTDCDSVEGLEFIGLEKTAAQALVARFEDRYDPNNNPSSLMDFVVAHPISRLREEEFMNMDPREAMKAVGVCQWLRDAITAPNYRDVCNTETLYHWVASSLQGNYGVMVSAQDRLKRHAIRLAESADDASRDVTAVDPSVIDEGRPLPLTAQRPASIPGHAVLYKGMSLADSWLVD